MPTSPSGIIPENQRLKQYELGVNMVTLVNGDVVNQPSNKGFSVDITGTCSIRPRGNSAAITAYPVVAGIIYPIDIADFTQSACSDVTMKCYLHRQG